MQNLLLFTATCAIAASTQATPLPLPLHDQDQTDRRVQQPQTLLNHQMPPGPSPLNSLPHHANNHNLFRYDSYHNRSPHHTRRFNTLSDLRWFRQQPTV